MKRKRRPARAIAVPSILAAALLCGLAAAPATAQTPLSDAIAAYRTGELREAFRQFGALAAKGNAIAQYNLGVMYLNGQGTGRDLALAARWHRHAAERGVAAAQYGLGVMYFKGDGVGRNHVQAARWFRAAARQDHFDAQFNLGMMHVTGRGVPRDMSEAVKWISLAAARDHPAAMFRLGSMHETGEPFARDPVEAARWYRKAAARGHAAAARRLAVLEPDKGAARVAATARHGARATGRDTVAWRPGAAIDQYDRPVVPRAAESGRPDPAPPAAVPSTPATAASAPQLAVVKPAARKPAATAPAFAPAPRSRPRWMVQVGSFPTRGEAGRAWSALHARFGNLFAGLSPRFDRAKVRDKGTFHRLRLGPLMNRADAVKLCRDLLIRAHGHGCLPIPPREG